MTGLLHLRSRCFPRKQTQRDLCAVIDWGMFLETPVVCGKCRIGQRKKSLHDAVTGEASADPSGAQDLVALQISHIEAGGAGIYSTSSTHWK